MVERLADAISAMEHGLPATDLLLLILAESMQRQITILERLVDELVKIRRTLQKGRT